METCPLGWTTGAIKGSLQLPKSIADNFTTISNTSYPEDAKEIHFHIGDCGYLFGVCAIRSTQVLNISRYDIDPTPRRIER